MTQIPIKLLKDKAQRPFIPYVPADAVPINSTDYMLTEPEGILELLKVVPHYSGSSEQVLSQKNGALDWQPKPVIPTKTSQLTNDSHFVSDSSYVHTDNNYSNTDKSKLAGIANGAEVNVQADWNVTDTTSDAYIKNKPNFTQGQSDWTEADSSSPAYIKNKPTIPTNISDLNNDSTFEDSTNKVTSISNASTDTEYPSAKSVYDYIYNYAPPAYLGSITDYNSQAKALDITDLKPGLYLLYGDYYNAGESLYVKYKYNGSYVVGHKTFTQNYFLNHQLCLKVNDNSASTIDDVLGTISYSEVTDGGSSNATTVPLTLTASSISFSGATEQGFNAVKLDDTQTITGLKMFSALPRSAIVPTVGEELTNKTYVDSVAGGIGLEDVYDVSELEAYDSGATYQAGDYVYNDDKIYKYSTTPVPITADCGVYEYLGCWDRSGVDWHQNLNTEMIVPNSSNYYANLYVYKIYSAVASFELEPNTQINMAFAKTDLATSIQPGSTSYIIFDVSDVLSHSERQDYGQKTRFTYTNTNYPNASYVYISTCGNSNSSTITTSWGTDVGVVVDLNGGIDPTEWEEKSYLDYLDDSINTGGGSVPIFMYDGSTSSASVNTINQYYTNIKNGIPSVLLLVTDQYPLGQGTASPTGKLIVPMSLDTTTAWTTGNRACLIGTAVAYDATDVYFVKQVAQFYNDAVSSLYALTWLNRDYLETDTWLYRSGLDIFSTSNTYAVGDYVQYNNTIYRCTTAVTTAGAWNASNWTQLTYLEYLNEVLIGNALGGSY